MRPDPQPGRIGIPDENVITEVRVAWLGRKKKEQAPSWWEGGERFAATFNRLLQEAAQGRRS